MGEAPPALGEGPGSSLTPPLLLPAQGHLRLPGNRSMWHSHSGEKSWRGVLSAPRGRKDYLSEGQAGPLLGQIWCFTSPSPLRQKPSPGSKLPPESLLPQTAARFSRFGEVTRHSTFDSIQQGTSLIRYWFASFFSVSQVLRFSKKYKALSGCTERWSWRRQEGENKTLGYRHVNHRAGQRKGNPSSPRHQR